jgi:uncharacterized protein (TIGR04255 family)
MFEFLGDECPTYLSNHALTQVTAQLAFSAQSLLSEARGVALLQESLSEEYPRLLSEQQQTITAGPGGLVTSATPQWRMTDLSGDWSCVVGPEQLAVETTSYSDWSEMRGRLIAALNALSDLTRIRVRERIGLRYVNLIDPGPDGSYSNRLRPDLLGLPAREGWRENVRAFLAQTVLEDENVTLVVRSGMGANITNPEDKFVVDIDCYDENAGVYDVDSTMKDFDAFNDVAYRCFCSCVTDDLRISMK